MSAGYANPADSAVSPSEPVAVDPKGLADRNASYSCLSGLVDEADEKPLRSNSYSDLRHLGGLSYESKNLDVPVVVVSAEVEPYSKSGGLAIVAGAYGYEFAVRGHRTMVVSPMYDDYADVSWVADKDIDFWGSNHRVKYFLKRKKHNAGGVTDYVFVHLECFRGRAGGLYHDKDGEYGDNLFRFGLFSLAALEAPLCCNIEGKTYGDKCLFLANDWQAGLIPTFIVHRFRPHGTFTSARCIFVVHNMGYQGSYPWTGGELHNMGLPDKAHNDLFFVYPEHMRVSEFDKGHCINLTKAALITCDRVLTVSANYAKEIQTPEGGFLLEDYCRGKGIYLAGIQNGIEDTWDPKSDKQIAANYSVDDLSGKAACKAALQESLGLQVDPDAALVGFVGRLTWQKGVDILRDGVLDWLLKDEGNGVTGRVQVILMGNGDAELSEWLRSIESQNKGKVCGYAGFDSKVERKMMAGCDFLLMPSRYEPCGIPQMVALAYGTLPVVHATGGLKDSVVDARDPSPEVKEQANGYYVLPLVPDKMKEVLWTALETYRKNREEHLRLMKNGMQCDFYWPRAIEEYEKHFDYTLADPPLYK
mmetsp:Transcript_52118/g.93421  ORF Transcript_52118/g.93421 Transcript_52118/m.93421 type:complete len:589 (-) Transcript_52118:336-2102(-)|eukprot:CAMPEP_0197629814 /NCGR_PEP_ID=MMETSP1338-20131121/7523_1 /TAXON_ID=43686 ORGANISM="Pelagodinium beii, Strain RCC1491" /NCGR_SAMPLE_ID=MMETSP1338 /ASSEMBLY_ACC=CAM_ASM_000754 /LENGTH=588 /DNA_ID=CAMNT_0043200919 /DNA_START=35 /DNA_END=1801 /DNA_ORIENTATION=+